MRPWHLPDWQRLLRHARAGRGGRIRLGMRQVYILPTGRGWLFACLLAALLVAGINYGNNLIFALTFVLAGIGNAALLLTWRNLAGTELEVRDAEPVFAGQTARFPVTLHNPRRSDRDALWLRFAPDPAERVWVGAESSTSAAVPCAAPKRGLLSPDRLAVTTYFPVGLFRAWSPVRTGRQALVYPAPVNGVPLPGPAASDHGGGILGAEGEEDFAGLRTYRLGDPLHRISWKASARTETLYAKEFGAEAAVVRWLDWELVPAKDLETRLGILTAWVLESAANGGSWGLRIPGLVIDPDSGPAHRDRCLGALARFGL